MTNNKQSNSSSKFWTILQLVTLIAVIALFVLHFQKKEKLAYINTPLLLEKYKGMADAKQEYQKKAEQWKASLDTLSAELEQSIKQYEKDRIKMSEKEQKLTEELLRNKQQQLAQYQQAIQQKAQEEDKKISGAVLNQINAYIKEYGEKHSYQFILGANASGTITYADKTSDITEQIIQGLNRQYDGK